MAGDFTLVWDERLTGYDFGPGHPLAPVRVELTMALARELGVLALPSVSVVAPAPSDVIGYQQFLNDLKSAESSAT